MMRPERCWKAGDQIATGFYQTGTDTVIEQADSQNQMLAQRSSGVRLGARGFNVIGLDQAALRNDVDGKSVLDAKGEKDIISPTTDTKWSVFVMSNVSRGAEHDRREPRWWQRTGL